MHWGWERLSALAGVVAVVLWVVATLIEETSDLPEDEGAAILAWFQGETGTILASSFLFMLGSLFFLIFVGALRVRLAAAEGPTAFLTAIAFGAGLATGMFTILLAGPDLAGAISDDELTADSALTLSVIDDAFFVAAELTGALFLVATALVILRYRPLPRWLGWLSLVIALWMLIPPVGWAGLLLGFTLWTLLVSVLLWLRPAVGEPAAARPPG
jgi:hypothetical protein